MPSYNIFKHVNSKLGRQHTKALLAAALSPLFYELTVPTQPDLNDVVCEGLPQHRGLRPPLFSYSGVGSFTPHKNQISVSAVRWFFVLIRED